ncbi:MAG: hypothetical protein PHR77_19860 [Kiritimatiellae bacterium]|nr:hypothetical protein [Kiritimatiellia bacterium]MDD5520341.1 hypothetical protein [Kiritimatiellia bacterium]
MNHLFLGASIPFAVAAIVYLCKGLRASLPGLIITPLIMFLTMTWAVAPDLPRLFGNIQLYNKLLLDPRCNIFFWHYSIDNIEKASAWYPSFFVIVLVLLLFVAARELMLAERES